MNILKLKSARALTGKTQEEICKDMGMAIKTYCDKENGNATFKLPEIKKLSQILNLDESNVNDIFFDGELTVRLNKAI